MSDTCIICNSDKFKVVIKKRGFVMVKCSNCELVFTYPPPVEKELAEFYQQTYQVNLDGYLKKRPIFAFLNCPSEYSIKSSKSLISPDIT